MPVKYQCICWKASLLGLLDYINFPTRRLADWIIHNKSLYLSQFYPETGNKELIGCCSNFNYFLITIRDMLPEDKVLLVLLQATLD